MAGWAAGADRQSRKSGGLHPKGPTQCRTRACSGCCPPLRGYREATPTPPVRVRRQNAAAPRAASAASPARSAARPHRADQKRTLESDRPARRRARGPGGQPPPCLPAGSSVRRGKAKARDPWRLRRSAPARARLVRVPFAGIRRPGSIPVDPRQVIVIRMDRDAQSATRRRAAA
jgi:hypothetical protein